MTVLAFAIRTKAMKNARLHLSCIAFKSELIKEYRRLVCLSVCLSVFTISLSFASLGIVSTLYYRGMKTLVSRRIQQRSFREMRRLERKNKYKGRLSGEGNIFLLARTIAMIGDQLCVPECYFSFSWLISGDCELTTWWLLLLSWVTNSRDNLDCITRIC